MKYKYIIILSLILLLALTSCTDNKTLIIPTYNTPSNLVVKGNFTLATAVEDDLFFPTNVMRVAGAKQPEQDLYTLNFDDTTEEEVYITFQLPHARKIGSDMEPHFHWETEDNTAGNVVWCMEFSNANIGGNFSTFQTRCVISASTENNNIHIMSPEIYIPNVTLGASAMGKIRLYRDSTNISDTYGADAKLIQFDIHIKIDKLGAEP